MYQKDYCLGWMQCANYTPDHKVCGGCEYGAPENAGWANAFQQKVPVAEVPPALLISAVRRWLPCWVTKPRIRKLVYKMNWFPHSTRLLSRCSRKLKHCAGFRKQPGGGNAAPQGRLR